MKTYVFFIGGTGARVLRSLTMLLASGVEISNENTIVPIIIDYDAQNGDLSISNELMHNYCELHKIGKYENNDKGFFGAKIENSKNFQLVNVQMEDGRETFAKFINYRSLDNEDKLLLQALYNDAHVNDDNKDDNENRGNNLEAKRQDALTELFLDLSVGFQGNPNIGTVVFSDYFQNSTYGYKNFVNDFNEGDRVFIVGSIFGGTGSSGFPQLVKKFREKGSGVSAGNSTALANAPIGGCLVLPYFSVKPKDDSSIDSMTFNSKAKAALTYYNAEIKKMMDEIYYVGCKKTNEAYENIKGGADQKNDAHLVELISAMSVVEFANREKFPNHESDKEALTYEFRANSGLDSNGDLKQESFLDLFGTTQGNTIGSNSIYSKYIYHLNSFAFFAKYCQDYTFNTTTKGLFSKTIVSVDNSEAYYQYLGKYINSETDFGKKLNGFQIQFKEWTDQLAKNRQLKFNPYDFGGDKLETLLNVDNTLTKISKNPAKIMRATLQTELTPYKGTDIDGGKIFLRIGTKAGNAAADIINNN